MKVNEIKNIIEKLENQKVTIGRYFNDENKYVVHYKTNNKIIISFFETDIKGNIVETSIKRKETEDQGINILNSRSQIDGWYEVIDLEKTNENKEIVKELFNNIFYPGASNKINILNKYISDDKYFQHNVDNGIGDGLDELKRSVIEMTKYGSDLQYDKNIVMIAKGNFVFTISEQYWKNPKTDKTENWEYFDIFRIKDKKIVEHWDVMGAF